MYKKIFTSTQKNISLCAYRNVENNEGLSDQ